MCCAEPPAKMLQVLWFSWHFNLYSTASNFPLLFPMNCRNRWFLWVPCAINSMKVINCEHVVPRDFWEDFCFFVSESKGVEDWKEWFFLNTVRKWFLQSSWKVIMVKILFKCMTLSPKNLKMFKDANTQKGNSHTKCQSNVIHILLDNQLQQFIMYTSCCLTVEEWLWRLFGREFTLRLLNITPGRLV